MNWFLHSDTAGGKRREHFRVKWESCFSEHTLMMGNVSVRQKLVFRWSFSVNMGWSQFEGFWHQRGQFWRPPPFNNLMFFAWAGFVGPLWTFVLCANESYLNVHERDEDERAWHRKCVFVCVCHCRALWTKHQKMGAEGRDWTRKHAESHTHIIYSALSQDAQNFGAPL